MFSFRRYRRQWTPKTGHAFVYFLCPRENGLSIDARTAEITNLLKAWGSGDEAALARLTEHVYPELRLMARRYMKNEAQGNTLQATALVHEVYLRLVDVTNVEWQARAQFFAMAAQMMRRILVDAARARGSRQARRNPAQSESGRIRRPVARARPIHPRSRRGSDRVLPGGAAPGQGGRAALFRRIDGGGNRQRP